jgi:enterochelin esterase family protein
MVFSLALASALVAVDPITPSQLREALFVPPRGESALTLAARIRANFPKARDLKDGNHWVEGGLVGFVVEVEGQPADPPRLGGMLNHSQGFDLLPIGDTGLWARVEEIPTDTKFSYNFQVGEKTVGARTVEMPGWSYPPESKEQPDRNYGEYRPLKIRSRIFENERTGWVYVPAAYKAEGPPAALMVFQDGDAYKREFVGTVVDNLIAEGAMPVTILVLLNPGVNDDGKSNRSVEYDSLGDTYARFLETEVLPGISQEYNVRDDPRFRAIGGASSGGICAFNAAWERPGLFGKVCSHIGSFTNIRGGNVFPKLVRETDRKPIRVLMYDGTNDLINKYGDWWQANEAMFAALAGRGYEVHFLKDRGFHAYWSGGRQLPASLRWLWADVVSQKEK